MPCVIDTIRQAYGVNNYPGLLKAFNFILEGTIMKHAIFSLFVLCTTLLVSSAAFAANSEITQCIKTAKSSNRTCVQECQTTRDQTIIECQIPSTDCGDACKAAYLACVDPVKADRDLCTNTCETSYEAARVSCGTQCACTPGVNCTGGCFGSCMDAPSIARAACRTACSRNSTFRSAIKLCGRSLRLCGKACTKAAGK